MKTTKRKPDSLGTILKEEFIKPYGLNAKILAKSMGVSKTLIQELMSDKKNINADIAIMLAKVFNNTPQFWLNIQNDNRLWEAMHDKRKQSKFKRVISINHLDELLSSA